MTATRSSDRLPDGREIYYYGEAPILADPSDGPSAGHWTPDRSELRWDPLMEEWVIVAPHRRRRAATGALCPLCPTRGDDLTEIPAARYDVAVFENRFPALSGPWTADFAPVGPLPRSAAAAGRCEVISYSSEHDVTPALLPAARLVTVIEALADRTAELGAMPGVQYVFCFENHGAEVGATVSHAHGQVYAYPFVPPRIARMRDAARHSAARGAGCLFCEVQRQEAAGSRVVERGDHWTAFVPYAARWPYEIHLYPRRHLPDLAALTPAERAELAQLYGSVLRRLAGLPGGPLPYMALWIQAPVTEDREVFHLHLQIFTDRAGTGGPKRLAAGELGAGVFVSEVDPERAAEELRAVRTSAGLE
ncbi:galactose-1-phosphate uridylyltransferase [Kitasatospora sp. NPDC001175]|uniref:galactose-1-phosphate uridylyltransferase n=1 Tax=Kitasatospora sp. NPDC001175 TaxID=3157103 RepID=UPI003CFE4C90